MTMSMGVLAVLCLVATAFAASAPNISNPKYLSSPELSCLDIKFIIDYHNICRQRLNNGTLENQPKAANIEKIAWDPKLAELATNYSKKMVCVHNPNRKDARWPVGENLFMSSSSSQTNKNLEWKRAIDAWYNENRLYRYQPIVEDPTTGHYTQVIWYDTIYVGCGCTLFTDSKNWLYKYYVCNYGPSGNWIGDFPYSEDVGLDEYQFLLSLGEITEEDLKLPTNDLLCSKGQCAQLYGPKCTPPK